MKKNYTISVPVGTFWTVIVPLTLLVCVGGCIMGIVVVDRVIMPGLPGIKNRGVVEVPDIVDKPWEDARQALYDVGLRIGVEEREYSDTAPKGSIVQQRPGPHEEVKKGRHILVALSMGPEVDTVPAVAGLAERAAKNVMRERGFGNLKVAKRYHERVAKDFVVKAYPSDGTVTSREASVVLTISKGPRPTHAEVPNVIGEMLSEARMKIEENGLEVGRIEYRTSGGSRPGSVVSQSVSPGASVPLESTVDLTVCATR